MSFVRRVLCSLVALFALWCVGSSAFAALPPPPGNGWQVGGDFPAGACYGDPPGATVSVPAGMWQSMVVYEDGSVFPGLVYEGDASTHVLVGAYVGEDGAGGYTCAAATEYIRAISVNVDAGGGGESCGPISHEDAMLAAWGVVAAWLGAGALVFLVRLCWP